MESDGEDLFFRLSSDLSNQHLTLENGSSFHMCKYAFMVCLESGLSMSILNDHRHSCSGNLLSLMMFSGNYLVLRIEFFNF